MSDGEILEVVKRDHDIIGKLDTVSEPLAYEILNVYPDDYPAQYHLLAMLGPIVTPRIASMIKSPDALGIIENMEDQAVQMAIVQAKGSNIKYIYDSGADVSDDVQLAAINKSPDAFEQILVANGGSVSPEVEYAGIVVNPKSIAYIDNPSAKSQLAAVTAMPNLISQIDNPTTDAQLTAYSNLISTKRHVSVPPEVQGKLVELMPQAVHYITNLNPELKALYPD